MDKHFKASRKLMVTHSTRKWKHTQIMPVQALRIGNLQETGQVQEIGKAQETSTKETLPDRCTEMLMNSSNSWALIS